jgi:uncharacterized small protein (DUF1192 family)
MAGDWIKMRGDLDTDPDVVRTSVRTNLDEFAVVGRLHKLWSWADKHSANGLLRVSSDYIDRIVACPGFADALVEVGWLRVRRDHLELPEWSRHNGLSAKARAGEAARKRSQRSGDPSEKTDKMSGQMSGKCPDQRREEKRYKTPPRACEEPSDFNSSEAVTLPTREEVLAFAQMAGVPADVAGVWHDETDARPITPEGAWTDKGGRPIARWQSALKAYAAKWASNDAQRAARPMAAGARAKRGASVWELQQRIEAAQKEIDRISANPANKEQIPDSFDRRLRAEPMAQVKQLKARILEMRAELAGVERKEAA